MGVECVGLTARGPECHEETEAQLMRCGIFHDVFATTKSIGALAPAAPGELVEPLTHLRGIIYCSGSRKPAGLRAFEAAAHIAPDRRVVLLDDREAHCKALLVDRRSRDQPFLGLHYAPAGVAEGPVEISRGWQLLAAALATPVAGRQRLRRMLDILDRTDRALPTPLPPPRLDVWSVALGVLLGAGAGVGATALWTARRR